MASVVEYVTVLSTIFCLSRNICFRKKREVLTTICNEDYKFHPLSLVFAHRNAKYTTPNS
jgi:hypothetical protein